MSQEDRNTASVKQNKSPGEMDSWEVREELVTLRRRSHNAYLKNKAATEELSLWVMVTGRCPLAPVGMTKMKRTVTTLKVSYPVQRTLRQLQEEEPRLPTIYGQQSLSSEILDQRDMR